MPRYPACSGAPFYGTPIQTTFTYPAVDETTGLTTELPTSEPTEAQVSYTIAAGHLPTLTGTQLAYELAPIVWAYGQNSSGGAATVSYRMSLNSTSVATGTSSSITNAYYWGFSSRRSWGTTMPVVGDVLNVKLWASTTGVYLNAKAMQLEPTRIRLPQPYKFTLCGAYVFPPTTYETSSGPSFGTLSSVSTHYIYPASASTGICAVNSTTHAYLMADEPTMGIFSSYYGDAFSTAGWNISASSPLMYHQQRILSLSLLPLNIKL